MLLTESNFRILFIGAFILLAATLIWLFSASAFAQTETAAQSKTVKTDVRETMEQTVLQPVIVDLRGITVGMTVDEVKNKLGKPETEDAKGLFYVFSDEESVQIALDADKKVRTIVAFYIGEDANAPKFEDIFGADTEVEEQTDGRIYKLVNYPDAGYWVAYSRIIVKKDPMVTVTMQKMQ